MTGMQTVTPDPVVHAARRMIDDLGPLLNSMEEVVNEREMLRGRCEQIEQDYQALRKTEESTRREGEEAAEALAELRAAYQALLTEYEAGQQTLQHLSEKHGALVQERQDVTNRLEVVLRHLKV